jgi:hypothetical protein
MKDDIFISTVLSSYIFKLRSAIVRIRTVLNCIPFLHAQPWGSLLGKPQEFPHGVQILEVAKPLDGSPMDGQWCPSPARAKVWILKTWGMHGS